MKALMQMHPDKKFYPEANFTLRVTYGKVKGYSPKDAVKYDYFTTLKGIIEKKILIFMIMLLKINLKNYI